jgi:hypothetical protein
LTVKNDTGGFIVNLRLVVREQPCNEMKETLDRIKILSYYLGWKISSEAALCSSSFYCMFADDIVKLLNMKYLPGLVLAFQENFTQRYR